MNCAGGIAELLLDQIMIRERIRSTTPEEREQLFNELMITTIFFRRIETDPAFRWTLCTRIASDEEGSGMLRAAIIGAMEEKEGGNRHSYAAFDQVSLSALFSEESGLPLHFWQMKWAGILYKQIAFPTAIQTSPPGKQEILHPMDRAIISSFMQEREMTQMKCNDLFSLEHFTDALTDVACRWFTRLSGDEQRSLLNRRYPEEGWEPLIETIILFDQPTGALIDAARYCNGSHLIDAARKLYSHALTETDDPVEKAVCYREMGLLSRNLGDADRAFHEFQSALLASRDLTGPDLDAFDDVLIYLCETADRIGLSQEGDALFERLIRIADGLFGERRRELLTRIASSCRRSGMFDREYTIIEMLIEEADLDGAVLFRLDTLNRAMRSDGNLDYALLLDLEAGTEAEYTLIRGLLAFGAFQFDDALIWFKRSQAVQNRPIIRLWIARAAWYAGIPCSDSDERDDLLETRIIRRFLQGKSIHDAAEVLIKTEKEEDEEYDSILILLEAARGTDLDSWLSTYTELLQSAAIPQSRRTYLLRITGKVLSECGIKDAISLFRKALKTTTDKKSRAEILSEIAYWYESRAQTERAGDAYNQAISLIPQFPGGWYGRARTHAQNGEYDAAITAIDTAIHLMPEDEAYHLLKIDLTNLKRTDDLLPDDKEQIDALDRVLFLMGKEVPRTLIRRYQHLVALRTGEEPVDTALGGGPGMIPRGDLIRMRNSLIAQLRRSGGAIEV